MCLYGIKKRVTCRNKENDKQYETKRAWNCLQSWLVGNKGVLKGEGFNYPSPPPEIFSGKSEEKVRRK